MHHYLIYTYKPYISGLYSRFAASAGKYFFSNCHGQRDSPCRISGTTDGLKPSAKKKKTKKREETVASGSLGNITNPDAIEDRRI
jgi:hypothetical protein